MKKGLTILFVIAVLFSAMAIVIVTRRDSIQEYVLFERNLAVLSAKEKDSCYNGGKGATQCSISAGIDILGVGTTTGCSVTCGAGYYACCGIRCTCISNN